MDQNDKVSNDKITRLENEIKVLKNEVQAVLLDLRESYLNMENPFNSVANPATVQPIVITERTSSGRTQLEPAADSRKPEPETSEAKPLPDRPVQSVLEPGLPPKDTQWVSTRNPGARLSTANVNETPTGANAKLDILMVAALVSWADESVQKLGRQRSELVLDISQRMGYLSEDLKLIVAKLINLEPEKVTVPISKTKSFLESLMKLNRLLSQDGSDEAALQILSMESGDKRG